MNYQCINPSCDLHGETISEKIAQRRGLICELCGGALAANGETAGASLQGLESDAPLRVLTTQLPTVLAMPLQEYLDEPHAVLRLWHICEFAELTLRMTVMAGIAEHEKRLPAELMRQLVDRIERPTLGSWLGMARAIVAHIPPNPVIPELPATVAMLDRLLGSPSSPPEEGCLSLRNLLAHGGGIRGTVAEKFLSYWKPRMAEYTDALAWLVDARIIGRDAQGLWRVLKGVDPKGETATDELTSLVHEENKGGMWLIRGGRALALWPLGRYAAFGNESGDVESGSDVAQVYIRRGEVALQYLNFGGPDAISESDMTAIESFNDLFQVEKPAADPSFSVRGFEEEFRKEADRRIGRDREKELLVSAISNMRGGSLWLGGVAGMGKSCLLAAAATELLSSQRDDILILPYRFRSSDERCCREVFIQFSIERIEAWDGLKPRQKEWPSSIAPIERLRDSLARVKDGKSVMFILDGLDEISERDSAFVAHVVLDLASDQVSFVCSGRPEQGIPAAMSKAGAIEPFPGGLPPMSHDDVRAMLLSRIEGQLRKRLIRRDKENADGIINPFVERVVKLSEGLPLYINYVVGDILSGRIAPEAEGQLPAGLHAYHDELLRRYAIGDLNAVMTPVIAVLTVAHEPLAPAAIAALLARHGTLRDADISLVTRAFSQVAPMVRQAPCCDGGSGYTLFHQSLRQHILGDGGMRHTVGAMRETLAAAAERPTGDAAEKYLYRQGVRHLLDVERYDAAIRLLTGFDYVMDRLQNLGGDNGAALGYYSDWDGYREKTHLSGDAEVWWEFLLLNRHLLLSGNSAWGAHKILLQLAMEHADDSPITKAAERFLESDKCNWLWLKKVNRPVKRLPNPCVEILPGTHAKELSDGQILCWPGDNTLRIWDPSIRRYTQTLRGHTATVWGAIELNNGDIATWSSGDPALHVWDRKNGVSRQRLEGHSNTVEGAIELKDGQLLSWSTDGTMRTWDLSNGQCSAFIKEIPAGQWHIMGCSGAKELADGRILFWSTTGDNHGVRIWDRSSSQCHFDFKSSAGSEDCGMELPDKRILTWGAADYSLRIWDNETGINSLVLKGHSSSIKGALLLSSGHVLSWSMDSTMRLWDVVTGQCVSLFRGHDQGVIGAYGITGASELPNGDILSWAGDRTIRVWERKTGKCCICFQGHTAPIVGCRLLKDGRILSGSDDGTLRVWNQTNGTCDTILEGHAEGVDHTIVLRDGRIMSAANDGTLRIWVPITTDHKPTPRHNARIKWMEELLNGHYVSWAESDASLKTWNSLNGECELTLKGHTDEVVGALLLKSGNVLSWAMDGSMRVWDTNRGDCRLVDKKISASVVSDAFKLSTNRILARCTDQSLCIWNEDVSECIAILRGHETDIHGANELSDGLILSWCSKTLRIWDQSDWQCKQAITDIPAWTRGVMRLQDKRFLCRPLQGGTLTILDGTSSSCSQKLQGRGDSCIYGTIEMPNGRVLAWGWSPSHGFELNLWNIHSGTMIQAGHAEDFRRNDPATWWAFACSAGEVQNDWAMMSHGLFHRSGTALSYASMNRFTPRSIKPCGSIALSSGAAPTFLHLMYGSRRVTLEEASRRICATSTSPT